MLSAKFSNIFKYFFRDGVNQIRWQTGRSTQGGHDAEGANVDRGFQVRIESLRRYGRSDVKLVIEDQFIDART